MVLDEATMDRCIPAGEVIEHLAQQYQKRGVSTLKSDCERAAVRSLASRLQDGLLEAWTANCRIESTIDTGPLGHHTIVSPWDFYMENGTPKKVPQEFWMHFCQAGEENRTFDAVTGDFAFQYVDDAFSWRDGIAYGVQFDHRGLPALSVSSPKSLGTPDAGTLESDPANQVAPRGRNLADWWPDFVAELVCYATEGLIPDGIGHQGQSTVFNEVAARLSERGKVQPNRTQTQETINAVLRRMRQPEKP